MRIDKEPLKYPTSHKPKKKDDISLENVIRHRERNSWSGPGMRRAVLETDEIRRIVDRLTRLSERQGHGFFFLSRGSQTESKKASYSAIPRQSDTRASYLKNTTPGKDSEVDGEDELLLWVAAGKEQDHDRARLFACLLFVGRVTARLWRSARPTAWPQQPRRHTCEAVRYSSQP